jgi:hypothetical protein
MYNNTNNNSGIWGDKDGNIINRNYNFIYIHLSY